jgi:2-O-(6-phospho-alpha-D-mannosyl)-D-glycerate hydrolase
MPSSRTVFVVSHTHWDREWYLTFARFKVNLVDVVESVLRQLELDPAYRHFLLDGQAIILEDYLEVVPEDRERIARLVQAGALSLGPWYILPDEFLVSGEATVRNLLLGHSVCREFGGAQKVGYMPDSFGHLAQMPQILRRAGIDSFVYTRGNGDEIDELGQIYDWLAPDGSVVLAVNQWEGYCNAGGLGFEEIWHAHTQRVPDLDRAVAKVGKLLGAMEPRTPGSVHLLMNGCDHFPAQKRFGEILTACRAANPDAEFRHGSLQDYLAAVRAEDAPRKPFRGDLLGGRHHLILSGVWSARMPLKQQNDRAEETLAAYAEPIAAAAFFLHGRCWPAGLLTTAWKRLLENHPHDSICGCSTDDVHRQMGPRFEEVIETGEQIVSRCLDHLTPMFARRAEDDGETVLTVLNPLPERRDEVVSRMVVLQPDMPKIEDLELRDEEGAVLPFEVVESHLVERFWGIDYRAELFEQQQREAFSVYLEQYRDRILRTPDRANESDRYVTIRFLARELPAVGHANYFLAPRAGDPMAVKREVVVEGNTVRNDRVLVSLNANGTFDLKDLSTGRVYPGLNLLADREDAGDEYDTSPAPSSLTVTSAEARGVVRAERVGDLAATLTAAFDLVLPAELTADRAARSSRRVTCPVTVAVTVTAGSPVVSVETRFENQARDHRLRAVFGTTIKAETVWTDNQFVVTERPVEGPTGEDWMQPPPGTSPQREFSLVEEPAGCLAVFGEGLPEVEMRSGVDGVTIELTLLRSVGWLSRDDLPTRRCMNAGPTLPTPDAQCLGKQRFRYAVLPYTGSRIEADVKGLSRRWRTPSVVRQGVRDGMIPGGRGLVEKTSPATEITAIKRHVERDTLVVRLVNLSGDPVAETLDFGLPVATVFRTDLLEEREGEPLAHHGRSVQVACAGHEIVTLEIEFE